MSTPLPPATEAAYERTRRLSVREAFAWSVLWGFGEAYIQPYAIFLKAGPTVLALLSTLPGLVGAVGQMLGAAIMERLGHRRVPLVVTTTIHALSFIPIYLMPLLFPAGGAVWVVVIYTLAALLFSGGGPIWISLIGDVVPEDQRGRFFAHRSRIAMVGMVLSMLAASQVISHFTTWGLPWMGFGVLFFTATAARLRSAWLIHLHADPPMAKRTAVPDPTQSGWRRLRRSPFAFFALVNVLLGGISAISGPFFSLYMLRDLAWSYTQFTTLVVAFLVAQITNIRWWGLLCDRHGNRVVFLVTGLLLPLPHFAWFLTRDFTLLLVTQFFSGALTAGANLSASNYLYDSVTPAHRARVMSYQSMAAALVNLSGGLLGAYLVRNLPNTLQLGSATLLVPSTLPLVFLLAGSLRLLVSLLLLPHLQEVRRIEPVRSVDIIRRFVLAEPLWQQLSLWAVQVGQIRGNRKKNTHSPTPPDKRVEHPDA